MFLTDYWYAAAIENDVSDKPFGRIVCNEPIVFFRDRSGVIQALEDRCCHRHAPLSLGYLDGDQIRCGYHGWRYDGAGKCTDIPSQDSIPKLAKVQSYPAVERYGWIWVWIGDAEKADPAQLPDLSYLEDDEYRTWHHYIYGQAAHQLYMDNLLDISHTAYLHKQTIGTPEMTKEPLKIRRDGTTVHVNRLNRGATPGPAIKRWGNFEGTVDAQSDYSWQPPAVIKLRSTRRDEKFELQYWLTNIVTPETEKTTHFWFAWASKQLKDDPGYPADSRRAIEHTLGEDCEMIEAQQRIMDLKPGIQVFPGKADAPIVEVHRVLGELMAAEQEKLTQAAE